MRHAAARPIARRRTVLLATAAVLAAVDLLAKVAAQRSLTGGRSVDLGPLQLRLGYNPGVAFGLGDTLPAPVVLAGTGLISAVLAGYAWRSAGTHRWAARSGLAAILAGAVGNVVDRAGDGLVTDYLHTGWWPTFNLADTWITLGAALLVADSLRPGPVRSTGRAAHRRSRAPAPGAAPQQPGW